MLFVDGGDKYREVDLWAGVLPKGAVLMMHDWEDWDGPQADASITHRLIELGFVPVFEKVAIEYNSCIRVWRRQRA